MFYKKYIRSLVSSFLICCIIFLLLVSSQIGFTTNETHEHHDLYAFKSSIANSINRKKLLIISGSNSLYGISCKIIYENTRFPCANGGTTITLGIDYILHNARSWAKPGDIVLLPLEYLHYQYDGTPNQLLIEYVFAYDMNYFKQAEPITQISMITGISFKRLIRNIIYSIQGKRISKDQSQHSTNSNKKSYRNRSNKYGDIIDNQGKLKLIDELKPLKISSHIENTAGMKSISKFIEWCRINDITVLATWPNTIYFESYNTSHAQAYFHSIKEFYKNLEVPMLGEAKNYMYDKSLFHDSIYHLNTKGVRQRTQQLIDLLKPYLTTASSGTKRSERL